ncbi:MAG TPA: hypothetical protein VKZ79_18895 [Alphaproteobacteria bacterium]|nr:hypothetical protein [Alphaproteobacteria bacterium]
MSFIVQFGPPHFRPLPKWFAAWIALSILWTGIVGAALCHKAMVQARAAMEVERALDGCSDCVLTAGQDWRSIAKTYLRFGRAPIFEITAVPPAGIFVIGGLVVLVLRNGRRFAGADHHPL